MHGCLLLQLRMRKAFRTKEAKAGMLQKAYRGRAERRRAKAYFVLRRLVFTHVHVKALQAALNGHKVEAACTLQKMFRGNAARREFLLKQSAAMRMQRVYRGRNGRIYFKQLEHTAVVEKGKVFLWAVERLQARYRGRRTRAQMHDFFLRVCAHV